MPVNSFQFSSLLIHCAVRAYSMEGCMWHCIKDVFIFIHIFNWQHIFCITVTCDKDLSFIQFFWFWFICISLQLFLYPLTARENIFTFPNTKIASKQAVLPNVFYFHTSVQFVVSFSASFLSLGNETLQTKLFSLLSNLLLTKNTNRSIQCCQSTIAY